MYDAIIIGSGLSAISAALQLRPKKILMLDVGLVPPPPEFPEEHLYNMRYCGKDLFNGLIGSNYEALRVLDNAISPKLKGPQMHYFWQRPKNISQDHSTHFNAVISYARGGLANAWGAGVMRYTNKELQQFPISAEDLNPYYDELTKHIGITGEHDDLEKFFGSTKGLLPPLPLSPIAESFFKKYYKFKNSKNSNFFVGRLRMAVLSQEHRGRPAYKPMLQDFYQGYNRSIYNPVFTLQELCADHSIDYQPGFLVTHFQEEGNTVKVITKNLANDSQVTFQAKQLFIGAGNINTARIVLQSFNDFSTKLPLLDNPVAFIPFMDLSKIGKSFPKNVYPGAEIVVVQDNKSYSEPVQASVYGLYGPMRSDIIEELPLSLRSNIPAVKYLGAAMGMLQVFFPDKQSSSNYLQLQKKGSLTLYHSITEKGTYLDRTSSYSIYPFLHLLRKMGYFASSYLCKFPVAGSSIHYAGSLPMQKSVQNRYETNIHGLLAETSSVYIIDASTFPYLPSKNHSFTMMANAMRIAERAKNNSQ